jgi:hypothetical protein
VTYDSRPCPPMKCVLGQSGMHPRLFAANGRAGTFAWRLWGSEGKANSEWNAHALLLQYSFKIACAGHILYPQSICCNDPYTVECLIYKTAGFTIFFRNSQIRYHIWKRNRFRPNSTRHKRDDCRLPPATQTTALNDRLNYLSPFSHTQLIKISVKPRNFVVSNNGCKHEIQVSPFVSPHSCSET